MNDGVAGDENTTFENEPQKPLDHTALLLSALREASAPLTLNPGQILLPYRNGRIPTCHLLFKGEIAIVSSADRTILGNTEGPAILGAVGISGQSVEHLYRVESQVEIYSIDADIVRTLVAEHNLWESVASVLAYNVNMLLFRDAILHGKNAYTIVKTFLVRFNAKSSEFKKEMSVVQYILQRTTLSRSAVMGILTDLRRGGYIDMKSGRLISMVSKLPDTY